MDGSLIWQPNLQIFMSSVLVEAGFNRKELLNLGNFVQICFPVLKHLAF